MRLARRPAAAREGCRRPPTAGARVDSADVRDRPCSRPGRACGCPRLKTMPPTHDGELHRHGDAEARDGYRFLSMSPDGKWTTGDIPDQSGRVAIITGANTGLGYHAAADAGPDRRPRRAWRCATWRRAISHWRASSPRDPDADVTLQELDLSSLASVRAAAAALRKAYPRIDLLINNAGVMWTPKQLTDDGFEMQFGTNHLGHFALTGLLLDNLLPVRGSRVVTVSSMGHRLARRDPLRRSAVGAPLRPDRRLRAIQTGQPSVHVRTAAAAEPPEVSRPLRPWPPIRAARTPSWPATCPGFSNPPSRCSARCSSRTRRWARLPTLRAATDPGVEGGQYYGPDGLGEQRGHPKLVSSSAQSHDEDLQHRLWTVSEELTGVTYPV